MKYDYFGNTTLRVNGLLKNIELQLLIFKKLIDEFGQRLKWEDGKGQLQELYGKELINTGLVSPKAAPNVATICKLARQKSAPIENFGLITRSKLSITNVGHEFLAILAEQEKSGTAAQNLNEVLQIEYSSMLMLKLFTNYRKSDGTEGLLKSYLKVFKHFNGSLNEYQFSLLPLIRTCDIGVFCEKLNNVASLKSSREFIKKLLVTDYTYTSKLQQMKQDWKLGMLGRNHDYFKSSKGDHYVQELVQVCNYFYDSYCSRATYRDFENLIINNRKFKNLFVRNISKNKITKNNYTLIKKELDNYINDTYGRDFTTSFYQEFTALGIEQNLNDYKDLNKRYLKTTDCFEFNGFQCKISVLFETLIKALSIDEVLYSISTTKVDKNSLIDLTKSSNYKKIIKASGCNSFKDLKESEIKRKREKIESLLKTKFTTQKLASEILPLFNDRSKHIHSTDEKLSKLISPEATGPTCFEYVLALIFCHLNNGDPEILLNAGLSLDSQMLPKSHAVGGSGDIEIKYDDHTVLVEATLTESQNQRRAEMEPVTRHLGNILINIDDPKIRDESYGIFIAPHLDNNVLNDFRARRKMYWESGDSVIDGMNIASLSVNDLLEVINSDRKYSWFRSKLKMSFEAEQDLRGSVWYYEVLRKNLNLSSDQ
ncbi:AlwI family type II restriction endonuclease [Idiomarina abyssalis]|uniref:AlwI family type II restriction endonuclease n=1 Tax=Idiomarina abyssalis TaxID=86102 RepID=UPI0006C85F47|nr:AlwI family type II restriction endonuclease [Idiomarina abyssalis]KPD21924.1 hypothetical protein ADS78_05595 [Idiomarina abyssalis]RDX34764.1 AlwI family type II restriction endonuclease [Idiomarina sp. HD9-110m-PIT-SAG05]SFT65725.1 AlwI restriction endonuclease [Idiomarina abyssalis]